MRNRIYVTKSILGILCATSLMAAMASRANPVRDQIERGTIQNVDPQQSTLTVRDARNGSTHSYLWNKNTKFLHHQGLWRSKAIGAADLKPGEQVNVFYEHASDHSLARKVVVTGDGQISAHHKGSVETKS